MKISMIGGDSAGSQESECSFRLIPWLIRVQILKISNIIKSKVNYFTFWVGKGTYVHTDNPVYFINHCINIFYLAAFCSFKASIVQAK